MLKPYDGANKVRLPDGRECWEKETEHFGGSETTVSYQYNEAVGDLDRDYWGRIVGIKVWDTDGFYEPVAFLPVTESLIASVRRALEQGWAKFHHGEAHGYDPEDSHRLYSDGYLRICEDVLELLKAAGR